MREGVFTSYTQLKKEITDAHNEPPSDRVTRLVGLLFMRKGQQLVDTEIVPSLDYFNVRSGDYIHVFLPGWRRTTVSGAGTPSVDWSFSSKDFVSACDMLAAETVWKYSGGVDLLLLTTSRIDESTATIDYRGAVNIPLHELRERKLIESSDILFERLFRFVRSYEGDCPLTGFVTQEARVSLVRSVIEGVFNCLPPGVKENWDYARQFAIRDVSKENISSKTRIGFQHNSL